MDLTPYPDWVPSFIEEYKSLIDGLPPDSSDDQLRQALMQNSEWTECGAQALLMLVHQYGSFILANALALAEAMEIEDGELGL